MSLLNKNVAFFRLEVNQESHRDDETETNLPDSMIVTAQMNAAGGKQLHLNNFSHYIDMVIDVGDTSSISRRRRRRSSSSSSSEFSSDEANVQVSSSSTSTSDRFLYLSDPTNHYNYYLCEDDGEDDFGIEPTEVSYVRLLEKHKNLSKPSITRRKRLSTEAHPDLIYLHMLGVDDL